MLKISDFGTSRTWGEQSTCMSFAGTVAWMAPEVIRNEPCNEKVDIWSYGVLLWELLTCEVPYRNVDSSAIIWGVGSNSLQLPIPKTCPDGYKLLIKQCWAAKPRNRPSFKHILMHLDIAAVEVLSYQPQDYFKTQVSCILRNCVWVLWNECISISSRSNEYFRFPARKLLMWAVFGQISFMHSIILGIWKIVSCIYLKESFFSTPSIESVIE